MRIKKEIKKLWDKLCPRAAKQLLFNVYQFVSVVASFFCYID